MDRVVLALPGRPFRTEFDASGERLSIPIRLHRGIVLGAALSAAFVIALHISQIADQDGFSRFLIGVTIAATSLAFVMGLLTNLFAIEFIQVGRGKLVHGWRLVGFKRAVSYDIEEIRGLCIPLTNFAHPPEQRHDLVSLRSDFGTRGTLKFDTEKGSIYVGIALHEKDADEVLAWLARRLPHSATGR